jgi:hypothetical protein
MKSRSLDEQLRRDMKAFTTMREAETTTGAREAQSPSANQDMQVILKAADFISGRVELTARTLITSGSQRLAARAHQKLCEANERLSRHMTGWQTSPATGPRWLPC